MASSMAAMYSASSSSHSSQGVLMDAENSAHKSHSRTFCLWKRLDWKNHPAGYSAGPRNSEHFRKSAWRSSRDSVGWCAALDNEQTKR